jgi:hypothetical protein
MGRSAGRTESEGEKRGVVVPLKTLAQDGARERRGRGWKHCGREGRGKGKAEELVEGGLLMGVRVMTFW